MILFLAGCGATTSYQTCDVPPEKMQAYLRDKPKPLWPYYRKVLTECKRNEVLNLMEAGVAAMHLGAWDTAEQTFDQVIVGIEDVYGTSPETAEACRKARSLWYDEGRKEFRGEPYERTMVYYYRGILYLRRGDFDNARACFKSGVIQDAFAEEEQNRCDFALLIFLQGWASQCAGGPDNRELMREAYKEVRRYRPDFKPPGTDHNVLVLFETGTAPRKVADGVGHYQLKFRRGRGFKEERVRLARHGEAGRSMYPMEDILWQAASRGGRPIDGIVKGQVAFRAKTAEIGSALTDIAMVATLAAPLAGKASTTTSIAGGALGLAGIAMEIVALNMRVRADTRYWGNLPDLVHVYTYKATPGEEDLALAFTSKGGVAQPGLNQKARVHFAADGHGIAWGRSQPPTVKKPMNSR